MHQRLQLTTCVVIILAILAFIALATIPHSRSVPATTGTGNVRPQADREGTDRGRQ